MRHNRDEKRFDRTYSHLRAMFANMTNNLVMHGRIKTTLPKAKMLRKYAERMITLGKKGGLSSRRLAFAFMRSKEAVTKLFSDVAGRYGSRNGGYTRIMKLGSRPGDSAQMSIIELVESGAPEPAAKTKAPGKKAQPKAKAGAKTTARPKAGKTTETKTGAKEKAKAS
ncbi:MAG: 50S ribosomal protein L17 [Deltaproteobacteria bacterium]|nr:50S ribosomal protein L17 [Deltaproteobacteria bacterium]